MAKGTLQLKVINTLDEIPTSFASEEEEANFWDTHTMSKSLWDSLPVAEDIRVDDRPMGVSLTLSPEIAERLRHLAKKKGLSYLGVARSFVAERLYEEEKREGIIGDPKAS